MTYTQEHILLTWGGTLPSTASNTGEDIWQTGARWRPMGVPIWPIVFNGFSMEDIAAALTTWMTSATMYISSDVRLEWVKAAHLKTDGEYAEDPRLHEFAPFVQGGGGSSNLQPLQSSVVVSLGSGSNVGRANHGRMYLPTMSLPRSYGLPAFGDTNRANIMAGTKTLLAAIDSEISQVEQDFELAIMSKVGSGTTKPVRTIRVGNVADTQRRRRNRVHEQYAEVAYP